MLGCSSKMQSYYSGKATIVLIAGWSLIIIIAIFFGIHDHAQERMEVLLNVARAEARKDLMYKEWLGSLGGVYAEVQEVDPSVTPHSLQRNNLKTTAGKDLVYVDSATMMSQIRSISPPNYVTFSNIKTLYTTLPQNQPDLWEKEALLVLSQGKEKEYFSMIEDGMSEVLRLMLPMYANAACLKSFPDVEVKEGDLMGGVSISLPVRTFDNDYVFERALFGRNFLIWILGICGILFALRLLQKENIARGQAELLQEQYEQDRELLLNSAGEGIFGVDTSGNVTFVNAAAAQMLGYNEDELIGKNSYTLCSCAKVSDCPIYASFKYGKAYQGGTETFQHRDGRSLPIQFTSNPILRSERIVGAVVTFSDITERKKSEQRLRESQQRFKATFLQAAVGITQISLEGSYINVNRKFCEIIGYSEKELKEMRFQDVTHPDDLQSNLGTTTRLLGEEDLHTLHLEKRYIHKDGHVVQAKVSVTMVRNEAGKPIYLISIVQDITSQKELEGERNTLQAQLAHTQKMEAVGTLAGGIAHDFNNILTAILGYADMAKAHIPADNPSRKYIDQVFKAGNRSKQLVQQILTLSRHGQIDKKNMELSSIVHEVLKLLRSSLPASIELQSDIDSDCGKILANSTQIHQVVMNLCTNAFHAIEQEKGVIKVTLKRTQLGDVDLARYPGLSPGAYVQFIVSDSGHGMDQDTCGKIFDPYFTTKAKGKGTGLGLSVTHGIVKSYAGDIAVHSKAGVGTTFTILLPVIDTEDDAGEITPKDEQVFEGDEHVFVIDDEKMVVDVARHALESFGYQVTTQTDPVSALEIFRAQAGKFDLIITDMTMPKMTGDILAGKMLEIQPDIPVIICTGFSTQINKEKIEAIGIRELVMKPFLGQDLARAVRGVIDSPRVA